MSVVLFDWFASGWTFTAAAADSLGTADVATRGLLAPRAAADSLGTSDVAARAAATSVRAAADSLGTSDVAGRVVVAPRAAADALGTADAAARAAIDPRAAADALGTTDQAARVAKPPRSAADALGTTDAAARALVTPRAAADSLGTTDAATRAVGVRVRAAADTLGTADAATRGVVAPRAGADSLGTTDVASRARTAIRSSADTLGTFDGTGGYSTAVQSEASRAAYWRLADTSGVMTDAVGANPGTVVGLGTGGSRGVAGLVGDGDKAVALTPTGGGDRISVPDSAAVRPASITVEAWFTLNASSVSGGSAGAETIARKDGSYLLKPNGNLLVWGISNSAGFQFVAPSVYWVANRTYHVVGTFDGTTLALYLNGQLLASQGGVTGGGVAQATNPLKIGVYQNSANSAFGEWFDGTLDEVALYNAALTPARVLAHYQAGAGAAVRTELLVRGAADSLGTSDVATRGAVVAPRSATDTLGTTDAVGLIATDDFSVSDLATAWAAVEGATTSWQITGGVLKMANASVASMRRTDVANRKDSRIVAKVLVRTGPSTVLTGLMTRIVDASNNIFGRVNNTTGSLQLEIFRRKAGALTSVTLPYSTAFVNGDTFYLDMQTVGNTVTLAMWTSDPVTTAATQIGGTLTYNIAAGDQAVLGANVSAGVGVRAGGATNAADLDSWTLYGAQPVSDVVLPRATPDSLGTTDVAGRAASTARATADALGTTDQAVQASGAQGAGLDALGTTDVATRTKAPVRQAVDVLGSTDQAVRAAAARSRSTADALGTTDAAGRTAARVRAASDALGTSDAAGRVGVAPRHPADSLGTTDQAVGVRVLHGAATDALGTTDLVQAPPPIIHYTVATGTSSPLTRVAAASNDVAPAVGAARTLTGVASSSNRLTKVAATDERL